MLSLQFVSFLAYLLCSVSFNMSLFQSGTLSVTFSPSLRFADWQRCLRSHWCSVISSFLVEQIFLKNKGFSRISPSLSHAWRQICAMCCWTKNNAKSIHSKRMSFFDVVVFFFLLLVRLMMTLLLPWAVRSSQSMLIDVPGSEACVDGTVETEL